jgi:hypothetical protein
MVLFLWGALSDERTGPSFIYGAGPRQRSLSVARVPWHSWPYFTVSDLRQSIPIFFHILLALTTHRKHSPLLLHGADYSENKYRDSYLANPLARWLLPSKEL